MIIIEIVTALKAKFDLLSLMSHPGTQIVVIAHDFPPESDDIRRIRMSAFRTQQPTVFKYSGLAMICGHLDNRVEMMDEDWRSLEKYLRDAGVREGGKFRVISQWAKIVYRLIMICNGRIRPMWFNLQHRLPYGLHTSSIGVLSLGSRGIVALIPILEKVLNCRYNLIIGPILLPAESDGAKSGAYGG